MRIVECSFIEDLLLVSLPITYRELTEDFPKTFQIFSRDVFCLILTKLGLE